MEDVNKTWREREWHLCDRLASNGEELLEEVLGGLGLPCPALSADHTALVLAGVDQIPVCALLTTW